MPCSVLFASGQSRADDRPALQAARSRASGLTGGSLRPADIAVLHTDTALANPVVFGFHRGRTVAGQPGKKTQLRLIARAIGLAGTAPAVGRVMDDEVQLRRVLCRLPRVANVCGQITSLQSLLIQELLAPVLIGLQPFLLKFFITTQPEQKAGQTPPARNRRAAGKTGERGSNLVPFYFSVFSAPRAFA